MSRLSNGTWFSPVRYVAPISRTLDYQQLPEVGEIQMSEKKMEYAPMRVVIRPGSEAAKQYTRKAGIDPEALAPGFAPTPSQDLINHGGKTIRDLKFANFY